MTESNTPLRIAFVDTGNTGRSMTAAALARLWATRHAADVQVISRALDFNPYNVTPELDFAQLLAPLGIDLSAHRAAAFDASVVKFSDLILVMTPAHRNRILADYPQAQPKLFLLAEYATGEAEEVLDALGQSPAFYAEVFQQISALIPRVMEKLPKQ